MSTYGIQKQNKYRVFITSPTGTSEGINMMAETVSMPGQNIRTAADTLRYGPQREHAQAAMYGPISITFICTPGLPEKKYFENWQDMIINKETWEARFYKDYIGAIDIFSMDSDDNDRYVSLLYEVFPKTINAQDFGAASNDAYQTISVEFAFRWWESMFMPLEAKPAPLMPTEKVMTGQEVLYTSKQTKRAREMQRRGFKPTPHSLANFAAPASIPSSDFVPTPGQPTSLEATMDGVSKMGNKQGGKSPTGGTRNL